MACFGEIWVVFLKIWGTICISVPHFKFWGLAPLSPPWFTLMTSGHCVRASLYSGADVTQYVLEWWGRSNCSTRKWRDQLARRENARHENARPEITGPENARCVICRHASATRPRSVLFQLRGQTDFYRMFNLSNWHSSFIHQLEMWAIFLRHLVPWPSADIHRKFYGDRPRRTPPAWELNTRGVAKYSDFGPIEGHIPEMVKDRR